jgi:hypothetical protein
LEVVDVRTTGAIWLLDRLWHRLEVGAAVRAAVDARRFTTNMERVLFALVANRAVAPMSKLSAAEWAREDAAIPGLPAMDEDHAYRAMDLLVDADTQGRVQESVFFAVANLLNLEVDLLFFDTTSTYFERDDEDDADGFRRFGHSKDHRPDLPQIVIGLAVTREGIPVRCWCWPGNSNDQQVLAEVRDDLRDWKLGRDHRGRPRLLLRGEPGLPAPRRWALHRRHAHARRQPASRGRAVPAGPLPAGARQPARQGGPPRRHRRAVRRLPQPRAGRTRRPAAR